MVACEQLMNLRRVPLPLLPDHHLIAANCCKEIGHCRVHIVEAELLDGGTMSFLQIEREFIKVLQTAVSWHEYQQSP